MRLCEIRKLTNIHASSGAEFLEGMEPSKGPSRLFRRKKKRPQPVSKEESERDNNPTTLYHCKMCNKMIRGMGKLAFHMKTHAASAGAQAQKEKLAAHSAAGVDPSKLNTVEKRANLGPLQGILSSTGVI